MLPGIVAASRGRTYVGDDTVLLMRFERNLSDEKGHVFAPMGNVQFRSGHTGEAMFLQSGDSGAVEVAASDTLNLPGDFSIELWLKPEVIIPSAGCALISRFTTSANSRGWQIYLYPNGRVGFYQYSLSGSYPIGASGPDLRDGNWHHVRVDRTGADLRMFVDGVLVGASVTATDFTSHDARLSIGFQAQGIARYPFRGGIDEVRIRRARNP